MDHVCEICYYTCEGPKDKCPRCGAAGYIVSAQRLRDDIQNRKLLLAVIEKANSDGR